MTVEGVMSRNKEVATLVSECIGVWADIEFSHGSLLAAMLHTTDPHVTVAMYLSLSSAHSRGAVLDAAADKALTARELDLYEAVMNFVEGAYDERNKLAHWCWGYCDELPDGLVLIDPRYRMQYLARNFRKSTPPTPLDLRHVFLVRKQDVENILERLTPVRHYVSLLGGAIWRENSESDRAALRRLLSDEPAVQKWLDDLNKSRLEKREEALQRKPSPPRAKEPSAKQRRDAALKKRALKKRGA